MSADPRVGDYGATHQITVYDQDGTVADISSATGKSIVYRKPSGTIATKTAEFVTDGTDGKIKYTFAQGDLDAAGEWAYQANLVFSAAEYTTDVGYFNVYGVLV